MKANVKITGLWMMGLLLVMGACAVDTADQGALADNAQAVGELSFVRSTDLWVPEGTHFTSGDDNTLRMELPNGWIFVGRTVDDEVYAIDRVVVELPCVESSEEGATLTESRIVSMSEECATPMRVRGYLYGIDKPVTLNMKRGGFIRIDAGVSFTAEMGRAPVAFDEMFELPLVRDAVRKFYMANDLIELAEPNSKREEPSLCLPIQIFGRFAIVGIPESMVDKMDIDPLAILVLEDADTSAKGVRKISQNRLYQELGIVF